MSAYVGHGGAARGMPRFSFDDDSRSLVMLSNRGTSPCVVMSGGNEYGQLGIGTTGAQANVPLRVPFFAGIPIDDIETGCQTPCVRSGNDVVDDTLVPVVAPSRIELPL